MSYRPPSHGGFCYSKEMEYVSAAYEQQLDDLAESLRRDRRAELEVSLAVTAGQAAVFDAASWEGYPEEFLGYN
jgi:hypothetical protein